MIDRLEEIESKTENYICLVPKPDARHHYISSHEFLYDKVNQTVMVGKKDYVADLVGTLPSSIDVKNKND